MHKTGFEQINTLTRSQSPFLCLIDFDKNQPLVYPLDQINTEQLLFDINGFSNVSYNIKCPSHHWKKKPVSKSQYRQAFQLVQKHLQHGDSFLLNLTFPTVIETNLTLKEIFMVSQAKYKVWKKDHFVFFSPEPFIKIENGWISSYPMKGTIRTSQPDAKNTIMNSRKEKEEHLTIVDLIRNDLSMVATDVQVEKYRYVEHIKTSEADLLQVSSKITGKILPNFWPDLGHLLELILPAGSISGAPKKKTIEIINLAENYDRGYFTGIVGLFDGSRFDSGVMIRFVEQTGAGLIYKSGGGITINSQWQQEYQELIDKVYVPIV